VRRYGPVLTPEVHWDCGYWPNWWFQTFAINVSQIYDGDDEPVEMKIDLDKEAAN
jgi:hypothetical protein